MIEPDGSTWVTTYHANERTEAVYVGHCEQCEYRIPDDLRGEFLLKREDYRDGVAGESAYQAEGRRLWDQR